MVCSNWSAQNGLLKMVSSKWSPQNGLLKMVCSKWPAQIGKLKMVCSKGSAQIGLLKRRYWLWPSGRHWTPSDVTWEVTSRWPRSLGSDVTSTDITRKKLQFFFAFFGQFYVIICPKKAKMILQFFSSDVTWEVTSRWPRSLGSDVTSQWLYFHFKWPSLLQVARRWPEPLFFWQVGSSQAIFSDCIFKGS